jgi:UPF0716 protein FxsA
MRRGVVAALLLLPVVEIALAVTVSTWIGVGPTIIALLGLSLVGVLVLRETGRRGWQDLRLAARDGVAPESGSGRGLTMLAGFLLAVPGFLTAVLGLLLLLPPVRGVVRRRSRRWVESRGAWQVTEQFTRRTGPAPSATVVQGEVVDDSQS